MLAKEDRLKNKLENSPFAAETGYTGVHPALKTYFGYCFSKAVLKYKSLLTSGLEPFDIVSPQLGIMKLLSQSGPASQMALGQDMAIDKASMVKFIDGLEKKKWVRRVPDKKDRRIKSVEMTAKGNKMLQEISLVHARVAEEFLAPLTLEERKVLKGLLERLT